MASGAAGTRYGTRCLPAECTSPTDCGGYACGVSFDTCGRVDGYYCRSEKDKCHSDLDCTEVMKGCRYMTDHFRCATKANNCE